MKFELSGYYFFFFFLSSRQSLFPLFAPRGIQTRVSNGVKCTSIQYYFWSTRASCAGRVTMGRYVFFLSLFLDQKVATRDDYETHGMDQMCRCAYIYCRDTTNCWPIYIQWQSSNHVVASPLTNILILNFFSNCWLFKISTIWRLVLLKLHNIVIVFQESEFLRKNQY